MPFPETERVVFRSNPLKEVICQLRFPPILRIASQSPSDFQDHIRDRYPLYAFDATAEIPKEVLKMLAKVGMQRAPEAGVHRFAAEDEGCVVSLEKEFVAVSTTRYTRWEEFRDEIARAREALENVYAPPFYSRIGLRYQDVVDRDALRLTDTPWHELLNRSLLGLLGEDGIQERVEGMETNVTVSLNDPVGGKMRIRTGLGGMKGRAPEGNAVYVVDVDCYLSERTGGDDVEPCLDGFNRMAGNFFRWAISDRLHQALDPEPLRAG